MYAMQSVHEGPPPNNGLSRHGAIDFGHEIDRTGRRSVCGTGRVNHSRERICREEKTFGALRAIAFLVLMVPAVAFTGERTEAEKPAPITVTDIAGREVTVNTPVRRVLLGEGRQLYLVASLEPEDPWLASSHGATI